MRVHSRGVKPPLKSDADALTKAPAAPAHLSPEAKAEWKRVMPQLIERRILTRGDLSGIEAYCNAVGAARQITDHMRTLALPDLKLGGLQIRYMQTARQLAAEYGLTPTSRTRIGNSPTEDDDDDNPLLIGRNHKHD
ncbi:P27 family phage terminase small subunit [Brucella grignonensis]|uniref:Phage terminase, small subunit, P27 family n=1 Tax=Brucella grignonensis TaxID=94627 RepID=A0A256F794_9HYPH|nr:P27 family phage terminase small subunit [Brucella grignonensis]OYR10729.1 phage terminase, small subunit, P27 family [Brucella grignonensis]